MVLAGEPAPPAPPVPTLVITPQQVVLRNAADGPMSQAAAFEVGIDPGAGPRDVDGFNSFTNKASSVTNLRMKSGAMWADQRI